ncbi:M64 family metallopeptidase [Roseateles sp. NT4]|uniref:M64 family metallopeptidase n=1 Tax=Roseateles sp. NT4 TaxID=3453715 RepID=UPI003EEC34AE
MPHPNARSFPLNRLALVAVLAAAPALAQADALLLRLRQAGTSQIELLHAERGAFAAQPVQADADAQAGDLVLVGRDAQGRELFRRAVKSPATLHAETFDPRTGRIVDARTVAREGGVVELRVPDAAALASVDVLERQAAHAQALREGRASASAEAQTPLLRLSLADIDAAATTRIRAAAAPSGSAWLWQSGATGERMDIVLIGDGYTAAQLGQWQADAAKVANGLLADPLFAAHKQQFNVRRVDVVSAQSGVSEGGVTRNTALGAVVGCYGIARLVCANETTVMSTVGQVVPADGRDIVIVVANTQTYGGASFGVMGTMTMHPQAIEIALHEIGHSAFQLADEYDYGTCATSSEPSQANITVATSRNNVKWRDLIAAGTAVPTQPGSYANGTVGLFQGANYCTSGVYRPTENSRMRQLGQPWHAVNERRATAVFNSYAPGGTDPGTGTQVSGSLSGTGAISYQPGGNYVSSAQGGTFKMALAGPAGANFDLLLYRWVNNAWTQVARSNQAGSNDSLSYTGPAGYYIAGVYSVSGSGAFTLTYTFPK